MAGRWRLAASFSCCTGVGCLLVLRPASPQGVYIEATVPRSTYHVGSVLDLRLAHLELRGSTPEADVEGPVGPCILENAGKELVGRLCWFTDPAYINDSPIHIEGGTASSSITTDLANRQCECKGNELKIIQPFLKRQI